MSYAAVVPTWTDQDIHINTSDYVSRKYPNAVTVHIGQVALYLTSEEARMLGAHLVTAACDYDTRVEALEEEQEVA